MIEVHTSRVGLPYLVFDNRQIASAIDPGKEGWKWVRACQDRIQDREVILVFGVGSGYHLQALSQAYPEREILAFEVREDLLAEVKKIHQFPEQIRFFHVNDESSFHTLPLEFILSHKFALLRYGPSIQVNPHLYEKMVLFLTGRDKTKRELYAKFFPRFSRFMGRQSSASRGEILSIHEIESQIIEKQEHLSESDRIWLMLRELVK